MAGNLPLVLVLDSSDVVVETETLKEVAHVVGLDKHSPADIPDDVASQAIACIVWHTIDVDAALLKRMGKCKAIVRTGAG